MNKLRALTDFIKSHNLVPPEQLDSWTDTVDLDLVWKPDEKGLFMGDMSYSATIALERFNGNVPLFMALIGTWLVENDDDRDDLVAPKFQIVMLDDSSADVDLAIQFVEAQYLSEDPEGPVTAFGKTWSAIPYELWTAEQGEVVRND